MNDATAGTQLRAARDAQGFSLSALAASLKVGQSKLEALEADRLDLLPDATFARALAQTVCKALKIDPQPVLAALPAGSGYRLEQLGEGINTPFRDRGDRPLGRAFSGSASAWMWAAGAVAVATALVLLVPTAWWSTLRSERAEAVAVGGSASPVPAAVDVAPTDDRRDASPEADTASAAARPAPDRLAATPTAPAASAQARLAVSSATAAAASAASGAAPLRLRAQAPSWVEVVDAQGRTLISRTLTAGEQVALDGSAPLRLKIGNAVGTQVVYRGAAVDLTSTTKDNVARLELAR